MGLEHAVGDDIHVNQRILQPAIDYEVIDIAGRRGNSASTRACGPGSNSTPDGFQQASIGQGIWLHVEIGPHTPSQVVVSNVPTNGLEDVAISL